ncbi:MAG TPA: glycosyltransferase family 9 protein [Terriglobales bacterium]|nr:glycosyltransferase family 9 protein [Terriglobales bacterium]
MNILILKLGATGDVVRTTPLLRTFIGSVTWVTEEKNRVFLDGIAENLRCFSWKDRNQALDAQYDLAINLEDTLEVAQFMRSAKPAEVFGAYADSSDALSYTNSSKCWFDLSVISRHGKKEADALKLRNRRTYQELVFKGLGLKFCGERYLLPKGASTEFSGDVAIAAEAGPVWPMKKWAYYKELKDRLERQGLTVNVLPTRSSLLEHLSDVANHNCLVGGDSLPMHLALGTGTPCVSIFNCTSPWEIHDYGIQTKIVSPLLEQYFYQRGYDERGTTAIGVDEVEAAVLAQLETAPAPSGPTTAR